MKPIPAVMRVGLETSPARTGNEAMRWGERKARPACVARTEHATIEADFCAPWGDNV